MGKKSPKHNEILIVTSSLWYAKDIVIQKKDWMNKTTLFLFKYNGNQVRYEPDTGILSFPLPYLASLYLNTSRSDLRLVRWVCRFRSFWLIFKTFTSSWSFFLEYCSQYFYMTDSFSIQKSSLQEAFPDLYSLN